MDKNSFSELSGLDLMEALARETGTRFDRKEKQLELIADQLEIVMTNTRREILEKLDDVRDDFLLGQKRQTDHLKSISGALWLIFVLLLSVAWRHFR